MLVTFITYFVLIETYHILSLPPSPKKKKKLTEKDRLNLYIW